MKTNSGLNICLCVLVVVPGTCMADNWDNYAKVMSHYYNLDNQAFAQITCKVEPQPTIDFLAQLRQQLAPMGDKVRLTETMADYKLTFDKAGGLTIKDPSLDIELLSEKGVADPNLVRDGIAKIESGFKQQIAGVDAQLRGLFEGYQMDKKGQISITRIDSASGVTTIDSTKDGVPSKTTIRGSDMHTETAASGTTVISDSSYQPLADGSLLMDKFSMQMKQPLQSTTVNATVAYQVLGGIQFPQSFQEQGVISNGPAMQTNFVMSIGLAQCELRK